MSIFLWIGVFLVVYGAFTMPAYPRPYYYDTEEEQERITKKEEQNKRKSCTIATIGFSIVFLYFLFMTNGCHPKKDACDYQNSQCNKENNKKIEKVEEKKTKVDENKRKKKSTFFFDTPNPYFLFPQKLF